MTRVQSSFAALVALVAFAACRPGADAAGPRSAGPLANSTEVESAASAGASSCLPERYRADRTRWDIALHWGTSGPVACARELADDGQPGAQECWAVSDQGLGDNRPVPSSMPGRLRTASHDLPWTIDNVAGDRRAVISDERVEIRALPDERVIARMPLRDETGDRGLSASPSDALFVGEVLFLVDHDAGPHADVIAFTPPDRIQQVADEVYQGSVAVLDDRRVGLASPALTLVSVYDVQTGAQRRFERPIPKSEACASEDLQEYLLEPDFFCPGEDEAGEGADAGRAACCTELARTLLPYMNVSMVALDADRMLVALSGSRRGDFAVVDLKRGAIAREWSARCSE